MATELTQPITETKVVNTVQVTGFVNNKEEERCEVHYMTFTNDGQPYQRGVVTIDGKDEVKALYAEVDAKLAEGKNFETASAEILYSKVVSILR
jgi:hypothetical protein